MLDGRTVCGGARAAARKAAVLAALLASPAYDVSAPGQPSPAPPDLADVTSGT